MRSVVRWAIDNSPAMNMLMIGVLLVGTLSFAFMRREIFPEFDLEIVLVTVPYPGASPEEVEEGICQKIEEACRSIDGIKKMTSVAKEGAGSVVLELRADLADVEKVVTEVRSEVDRIPSFPELTEDPEVQQITMRYPVIKVGVLAPQGKTEYDELELRAVTERIREDLLQLKTITQVNVQGSRDYQIDIEIDENTLRKYGLTLQQVAQIVRRENLELPGGTLRSRGEEVLLRGKNKRLTGSEIAELPLVTDPGGVVLTIGDVGNVRDEFIDTTAICEIDGRPGLVLSVDRTTSEDILAMTAEVREYVANAELPGDYSLLTWGDRSKDVKDRLDMLIQNGIMGLILVFLVLAVFLELRLAFWVALGIPVAMLGAGVGLYATGQTLNMLSMFAFLMALGIIVDDAIVVGENVYSHRQMGKGFIQAAVDGTVEVIPSVVASVTTTIIAFCPMLFVAGIMGKFIAVMPFAVIAMLIISLIESTFILPCHLAHRDSLVFRIIGFVFAPLRFLVRIFNVINRWSTAVLERLINQSYVPSLRWALKNPLTVVASAVAMLLITVGIIRGGFVPYIIFPKLDSNNLEVKLAFPDGTPAEVTDRATLQIAEALWRVNDTYKAQGGPVVRLVQRSVGQQMGSADPVRGGLG
ncbi:MAG: efflux RND transporter permease subunit, partial [Planctomycetota bacterium]|nr:efflux RND transporter permease subunit [Planctomycetota bacterium]